SRPGGTEARELQIVVVDVAVGDGRFAGRVDAYRGVLADVARRVDRGRSPHAAGADRVLQVGVGSVVVGHVRHVAWRNRERTPGANVAARVDRLLDPARA